MISRGDALRALREAGCSEAVVQHSLAVERTALSIARRIREGGHKVDLELVERGALLHDIGRARTHRVEHGVEGAKILQGKGLQNFVKIAERHVGAGIPADEAKELGLPARDLIPCTIEEKIIAYADKLMMGRRRISYGRALEWIKSDLGTKHPAIERFKKLHAEIQGLMKKG